MSLLKLGMGSLQLCSDRSKKIKSMPS